MVSSLMTERANGNDEYLSVLREVEELMTRLRNFDLDIAYMRSIIVKFEAAFEKMKSRSPEDKKVLTVKNGHFTTLNDFLVKVERSMVDVVGKNDDEIDKTLEEKLKNFLSIM